MGAYASTVAPSADADHDVVAGVGADHDAEAAQFVQEREVQPGEEAEEKEIIRVVLSVRPDVMRQREEDGGGDRGQADAGGPADVEQAEGGHEAGEQQEPEDRLLVDAGAQVGDDL